MRRSEVDRLSGYNENHQESTEARKHFPLFSISCPSTLWPASLLCRCLCRSFTLHQFEEKSLVLYERFWLSSVANMIDGKNNLQVWNYCSEAMIHSVGVSILVMIYEGITLSFSKTSWQHLSGSSFPVLVSCCHGMMVKWPISRWRFCEWGQHRSNSYIDAHITVKFFIFYIHLHCLLLHTQHCCHLFFENVANKIQESLHSDEYYHKDGIKSEV